MLLDYIKKDAGGEPDSGRMPGFHAAVVQRYFNVQGDKDMNCLIFKEEYTAVSRLCQNSSYEGLEAGLKAPN